MEGGGLFPDGSITVWFVSALRRLHDPLPNRRIQTFHFQVWDRGMRLLRHDFGRCGMPSEIAVAQTPQRVSRHVA